MSTHKPSAQENKYFAREDTDKREMLAIEQAHAQHLARQAQSASGGQLTCPRCASAMRPVEGNAGAATCGSCQGMFLEAAALKAASHKEGYVTQLLRQVTARAWR